jgi:hypothetical protein
MALEHGIQQAIAEIEQERMARHIISVELMARHIISVAVLEIDTIRSTNSP